MSPLPPRVAEQGNHRRETEESRMSEVKEQWNEQGIIVPAAKSSALAVNGGSPVGAYLAQHGVGTGGTFIKFGKAGHLREAAGRDSDPHRDRGRYRVRGNQGWVDQVLGKGTTARTQDGTGVQRLRAI